ncbi:MAG: O-methyltransferase [Chitinophagaceae bacterium]|nr:O-methyltransferase [Chitinophagaceae bacterium]
MELINQKAEQYAARFSEPAGMLLDEIENFTRENKGRHFTMLSGAVQGKILEMISCMIRPQNILEVGTFMGYSALCLAKGLEPGGELHTIEIRDEDADTAGSYFKRSEFSDRIILHRGNALDIIPKLNVNWDLVFIDADKVNYIRYYELSLPQLKPKGVILADNVLFHGDVLEEEVKGKNGKAIQEFNEHVAADSRVKQVIMTVRDGLMVIMKK